MKDDFAADLKAAMEEEAKAQAAFEKLVAAKEEQIKAEVQREREEAEKKLQEQRELAEAERLIIVEQYPLVRLGQACGVAMVKQRPQAAQHRTDSTAPVLWAPTRVLALSRERTGGRTHTCTVRTTRCTRR